MTNGVVMMANPISKNSTDSTVNTRDCVRVPLCFAPVLLRIGWTHLRSMNDTTPRAKKTLRIRDFMIIVCIIRFSRISKNKEIWKKSPGASIGNKTMRPETEQERRFARGKCGALAAVP